jgi:hypothetical protein
LKNAIRLKSIAKMSLTNAGAYEKDERINFVRGVGPGAESINPGSGL